MKSNFTFIFTLLLSVSCLLHTNSFACNTPTGIVVSTVTGSTATIQWNAVAGATKYRMRYRVIGSALWTTTGKFSTPNKTLLGLANASTYQFSVMTVCSSGHSSYSPIGTFTTLAAGLPVPDHIVICILENHDYSQIVGNASAPYINSLVSGTSSATFSQSFALTHPSQPNYLELYSGFDQGVINDNVPASHFTTPNLGRQLIDAGRSFITYSEDLPSVGFDGAISGAYVRKHNPAANWMGTGTNQISTTTNQPLTAYPNGNYTTLPTVSYVVPNLNNDMHDGSIATGDTWVMNHLDGYIQWAKTHNSLFILTFDENDGSATNHILTIFCGQMVQSGTYANHIDHYNLLRTIEDLYSLPYAANASSSTTINYCWIPSSKMENSFENQNSVLEIYPNPANDLLNLNFNGELSEKNNLSIFDITGRNIYSKENIAEDEAIDVSGFENGIYLIRINSNGENFIEKFLKD